MAGLDEASIAATARTMAGVVCAPPYRSLLRQAPADILRRVDQPLLALYGGKDVQVPGQENAEAFRRVLAHRSRTAVRILPEHNHLFQRATTGAISEYESLGPAPDMLALREVETWLTAIDLDLDPTA
jgi:dienelactone hydrolase